MTASQPACDGAPPALVWPGPSAADRVVGPKTPGTMICLSHLRGQRG